MPENPSAFPQPDREGRRGTEYGDPGMTLRDYFAGQYLAGASTWQISCDPAWRRVWRWLNGFSVATTTSSFTGESLSRAAYCFADAMLAEREK